MDLLYDFSITIGTGNNEHLYASRSFCTLNAIEPDVVYPNLYLDININDADKL